MGLCLFFFIYQFYKYNIYFISSIAVKEVKARPFAYAIRNGCNPADVLNLFQVPPLSGHAKRITKILRTQTWRQPRLPQHGSKVWCHTVRKNGKLAEWKFGDCRREAESNKEFYGNGYWHRYWDPCEVVMIGEAKAPNEIVRILEKVPTFAGKTILKPQELLTLVRDVGDRVDQTNRDRCILDGVGTLPQQRGGISSHRNLTWGWLCPFVSTNISSYCSAHGGRVWPRFWVIF